MSCEKKMRGILKPGKLRCSYCGRFGCVAVTRGPRDAKLRQACERCEPRLSQELQAERHGVLAH